MIYRISRELIDLWLIDYPAIKKIPLCREAGVMGVLLSTSVNLSHKTLTKLNPVLIKYGYLNWYNALPKCVDYKGELFESGS